jgi:hypothetical protein
MRKIIFELWLTRNDQEHMFKKLQNINQIILKMKLLFKDKNILNNVINNFIYIFQNWRYFSM